MQDFASIDFETANECPTSVCSVGIVVVRGGEVIDKFYSLIQPEPNYILYQLHVDLFWRITTMLLQMPWHAQL